MANGKTLSGEALRDLTDEDEDTEVITGVEAVKEAADTPSPEKLTPAAQQSALDWFIGAEPIGGAEGRTKRVKLNVGSEDTPRWIEWVLQPIELDTLRNIRKRAANTREARRDGTVDEFRVNLEIVAAGTVEPNLDEAARVMAEEQGAARPSAADVLRARFHNRPGYITQLAGKVLTASGFDEEDVQDSTQVQAAGNS